jgi:hypothetical protein
MAKKSELLEFYCEFCRKNGAVMEVGPERYKEMAEISDEEMEEILVDLTYANAETLDSMAKGGDHPAASDQDVIDFMETMLHLAFHGYVAINLDGGLGCFAPEGPPPTDEEELAMDRRIRSAFPIIPVAVIRAAGGGKEAQSSKPTNMPPRR